MRLFEHASRYFAYVISVVRRGHRLEACDELLRQFRTVDQKTDLGIEMHRTLVEVHRSDEELVAIEDEHLSVQGEVAEARDDRRLAAALRIAEQRPYLEQVD